MTLSSGVFKHIMKLRYNIMHDTLVIFHFVL
jgi:hypothetical protein